jgi:hypothetical protein
MTINPNGVAGLKQYKKGDLPSMYLKGDFFKRLEYGDSSPLPLPIQQPSPSLHLYRPRFHSHHQKKPERTFPARCPYLYKTAFIYQKGVIYLILKRGMEQARTCSEVKKEYRSILE